MIAAAKWVMMIISNIIFHISVPTASLTTGAAVVGAGTLITCSWKNLPSAMTYLLIMDTADDLHYLLDVEMGDNTGMGLLDNTVGWLGNEKFFVYINKTEKRQMAKYYCIVGTANDEYRSNDLFLNVTGMCEISSLS